MSIKVNGRIIDWKENETIKDLMRRMKYTFPLVVVKINNEVIPRSAFEKVTIPDGATIAILHMISGG